MKCQRCSNPATVHLTKIIQKQKHELHLCQSCADKQAGGAADLSLSSILQSLIGQHVSADAEKLARLTCPTCGIKYMEFRSDGRLGCPADYETFRTGLEPILLRIHRATRHVGKVPSRARGAAGAGGLLELRQRLRQAVEREDYERAAQLRDLIRQREASDESGRPDPIHG